MLEPVCSGLQAQILHCYHDHLHEVLLCSDLVKAYQHCVSAAYKVKTPVLGCWGRGRQALQVLTKFCHLCLLYQTC